MINKFTFLLSLLIAFSTVLGQTTKELEKQLIKATGEEKVDVLYALAEAYHKEDRVKSPKTALSSGDEAASLRLYSKAHRGYLFAGKIYQERNNTVRAISAYEKAAKQAERGRMKPELMFAYQELADMNAAILRPKVALEYQEKYKDMVEHKIKQKSKKLAESLEETKNVVVQKESELDELEDMHEITTAQLDSVSKEKLFADLQLVNSNLEKEKIARELSEERNRQNMLIAAILVLLLLGVLFFVQYWIKKKANIQLAAKNEIIAKEKEKSDNLLLNILPAMVAGELKEKGKTTPQSYREASVLFTDFKSFTSISEQLTPFELVEEINYCFTNFDRIIAKYNIEKIKTIGDAYLCVSGLPKPNPHHCIDLIKAGLEMQEFMSELGEQRKKDKKLYFEMRLGIHTGPLVAGVVGSTKFAYDIWGDTVNTAARMEQNCDPGQINVSEQAMNRAKKEFDFTFRGKISAKNKGDLAMYYVKS